jgi:hypothetical protein
MEINQLIEALHKRLAEYKKSNLYQTIPLRQDILSVEIAVSLFEMAIYCNRTIKEDEKYWFKGGYYISSDITGEWSDIAVMYDKVVNLSKERKLI